MSPTDFSHDAAYKAMFTFPEMMTSLIRDFVREPFVQQLDFSTLKRISGETVSLDHKLGFNDMLWQVSRHDGSPCYLVLMVEFQSSPERCMAFRFFYYDAMILRRLADEGKLPKMDGKVWLIPIVFIVLYNGRPHWLVPKRLIDLYYPGAADMLPHLPDLQYILIDVHRIATDDPKLRDSLMARVIRLEQAMRLLDVDAALADLEQAAEKVSGGLYQAMLSWVCRRFDSKGIPGDWKENVKNFREARAMVSTFMMEFEADAVARGLAQGLEQGRELGLAQGRELGLEQGRELGLEQGREQGLEQGRELGLEQGRELGLEQGELKNQRTNLREFLEDRFGEVPRSARDFLDTATDMPLLRRLTRAAWRADSLDAFLARLEEERKTQSE